MTTDSARTQGRPAPGERLVEFAAGAIRSPLTLVGLIVVAAIIYRAIATILAGDYTTETFVRQMIFGLAQGSIYALIALGYTLVYGILFMINFAHGEVFMAGTYVAFFVVDAMDETGFLDSNGFIGLVIIFMVSILSSVAVAVLLERIAYRPLRTAPRLVPLITAIGASIFIQQAFRGLFGSSPKVYPNVHLYLLPGVFHLECDIVNDVEVCLGLDLISGRYPVNLLGIQIVFRPIYLLVFIAAILMMAALWFFVQRTKTGKAMRAVAEDKSTAALMGVNVDNVIVTTFVLGAALAGAAGVLFALYNRQVTHTMGFLPGLKAFTAAVLGGIGNIPGAAVGGFFLGIIESVAPSLLSIPTQLKDVIAFSMLVLVLIFRPSGILGEVLSEKKA
ncbi:MAG: branched-chain amino acid ABC transporter permease [Anaerolineae bacterium]